MLAGNHEPRAQDFYRGVLRVLTEADAPFLVGGAFALEHFAGVHRRSKDLDLFLRERDCPAVLRLLQQAGYYTEVTFPHWLAKVLGDDTLIDLVFNAGNGGVPVDDRWFSYSLPGEVLDVPVRFCPIEETIWSKSYIMERERYDGADIAHLLCSCAESLDWARLLERFGSHWRVLLSYLVLFGFIYPAERGRVPAWVMRELLTRCDKELTVPPTPERVCQGTLLSRTQYLVDVREWGYADARLRPPSNMTDEHIAVWTDPTAE